MAQNQQPHGDSKYSIPALKKIINDAKKKYQNDIVEVLKNDPERNAYKAAQLLAQKDFANALAFYDKAIAFDGNNETAYLNAAIAAANLGDLSKAIFYIDQVLKMNPEDLDALQIAMQLYQAKGDTQTAQKYYSQAQLLIEQSQQN